MDFGSEGIWGFGGGVWQWVGEIVAVIRVGGCVEKAVVWFGGDKGWLGLAVVGLGVEGGQGRGGTPGLWNWHFQVDLE